jgi:hypothetical protein
MWNGRSASKSDSLQPRQAAKNSGRSYHGGGLTSGCLRGSNFHVLRGGVRCHGYSWPHPANHAPVCLGR